MINLITRRGVVFVALLLVALACPMLALAALALSCGAYVMTA